MGQLVKDEKSSAIFQASGERAGLFATAQRHLQILEKWFIPIFSTLIAAYEIGLGLYLLKAVMTVKDQLNIVKRVLTRSQKDQLMDQQ